MVSQCAPSSAVLRLPLRQHQVAPFVGQTVSLGQQHRRQRLQGSVCTRAEVDVSQQTAAVEKTGPDFKALKDVQAIMDVLPHR